MAFEPGRMNLGHKFRRDDLGISLDVNPIGTHSLRVGDRLGGGRGPDSVGVFECGDPEGLHLWNLSLACCDHPGVKGDDRDAITIECRSSNRLDQRGDHGSGALHFDKQDSRFGNDRQDLLKSWHTLADERTPRPSPPGPGIELLYILEVHVFDASRITGGSPKIDIMHRDDHAISGHPKIAFDRIRALLEAQTKSRQRVLRRVVRCPSMRHDLGRRYARSADPSILFTTHHHDGDDRQNERVTSSDEHGDTRPSHPPTRDRVDGGHGIEPNASRIESNASAAGSASLRL